MGDLPWLRLYTDTVDNEKIRLLAFEDRWHYIALLCLKQQGILDNNNELRQRKIAVKLGVQLRELDEIKRRLLDVELIDEEFSPIGWNNHQFKSDSDPTNAKRQKRYRENKKLKTVTGSNASSNVTVTPTDTDTEGDKDKEKPKGRFTPPRLQEVRDYITEKGYEIDADKFFNHYETTNWYRGKTKIKNWKACTKTWLNGGEKPKPYGGDSV